MVNSDSPTGFEGGERVNVVRDNPGDHTTPGLCLTCGKMSDLQCGCCKSTNVAADTSPAGESNPIKRGALERFRRLMLYFQAHRNSKFALQCFLIASGDPSALGVSMTEIAKKWSVTRAAVSKECCF